MQTEHRPNSHVQCDLSIKMAKDLKAHMLQHVGKKFHSCNKYGYSSNGVSKLKGHMLVYSGEKPFVCKECNYSCTRASHLKTHMLIHQETVLSFAHSVKSPAQLLVTSRHTG